MLCLKLYEILYYMYELLKYIYFFRNHQKLNQEKRNYQLLMMFSVQDLVPIVVKGIYLNKLQKCYKLCVKLKFTQIVKNFSFNSNLSPNPTTDF